MITPPLVRSKVDPNLLNIKHDACNQATLHKHVDIIKIIGTKSFATFVAKAFSLGMKFFPWNAIYGYLR